MPEALPLFLALVLSCSYVAAIRISVPDYVAKLPRDHEMVINFRISRILGLCTAVLIGLSNLMVDSLEKAPSRMLVIRSFGIVPGFTESYSLASDLMAIVKIAFITCTLYAGPISYYFLTSWRSTASDVKTIFSTRTGIRDIVFAPITEEFIYRALVVCILHPYVSEHEIIYYAPLLFGMAHLHHGYTLLFHERESVSTVFLQMGFQFTYTTLFGIVANCVYLQSSRNLWCPIILHAICNLIGFPTFQVRDTHPKLFPFYCAMLVAGPYLFYRWF